MGGGGRFRNRVRARQWKVGSWLVAGWREVCLNALRLYKDRHSCYLSCYNASRSNLRTNWYLFCSPRMHRFVFFLLPHFFSSEKIHQNLARKSFKGIRQFCQDNLEAKRLQLRAVIQYLHECGSGMQIRKMEFSVGRFFTCRIQYSKCLLKQVIIQLMVPIRKAGSCSTMHLLTYILKVVGNEK